MLVVFSSLQIIKDVIKEHYTASVYVCVRDGVAAGGGSGWVGGEE